jgi:hypothetical protein
MSSFDADELTNFASYLANMFKLRMSLLYSVW